MERPAIEDATWSGERPRRPCEKAAMARCAAVRISRSPRPRGLRNQAGNRSPSSSTQSTSRMSSARLRSYIAAYILAALAKAGWSVTSPTRSLPI